MISLHNIFIEVAHNHCLSFVTSSFQLLILISLCHFVAGPDFCFVADLCNCAAKDALFLFCVVSLSFYSFLCCVFSYVMHLRQLVRLRIDDLLMAVVICDNRATRMCPSAMRSQAASVLIACVSSTCVYCCQAQVILVVILFFLSFCFLRP